MATVFQKEARFNNALFGLGDNYIETNFILLSSQSVAILQLGNDGENYYTKNEIKGNSFDDWYKIDGLASWEVVDRYRIKYRISSLFNAALVRLQIKEKWLPGEIQWETPAVTIKDENAE